MERYGVEMIMQFPEETPEGDVSIDYESFQPMTSIELKTPTQTELSLFQRDQAAFLSYYLMGQYRIVVAIAQDLQHILMSVDDDDNEEEEDEDEGNNGSNDSSSDSDD